MAKYAHQEKGGDYSVDENRVIELIKSALDDPDLHRRLETTPGMAKPLYPRQVELIKLIERKMARPDGEVFTVRICRQYGKNEIAGQFQERHLLRNAGVGGNIVVCAPNWKPQVVSSKARLEKIADNDPIFDLKTLRWREGYIATYGRATITYLTSAKEARQEGATADILLDVDEAHLTDKEVYYERLSPFTASTNANTVMFGVASDKQDLLYEMREKNFEKGRDDLNVQVPAEVVAAENEVYRKHFELKIEQLGPSHPVIMTQYRLIDIDSMGGAFTAEHQKKLFDSSHGFQELPVKRHGIDYVCVIDLAGEEESKIDLAEDTTVSGNPDCAVLMIVEVDHSQKVAEKPMCRVVHIKRWVGLKIQSAPGDREKSLQEHLIDNLVRWNPAVTVVDARGVGISTASWLARTWSRKVIKYQGTLPSVTEDIYKLWAYINSGQIKMFRNNSSDIYNVVRQEIGWVRSKFTGQGDGQRVNFQKPSATCKIDTVKALTYVPRAVDQLVRSSVWGDTFII